MNILGWGSQSVGDRLRRRLRRRYLRWLARQPVESVFLSDGWRTFWRRYRRRTNAFFSSRLVFVPVISIGVCMLLVFLAGVAGAVAVMLGGPPVFLFVSPEHHPFASLAQRDAVVLTRLTILQSVMLPLLLLWARCSFFDWSLLETHTFYEKYRSSQLQGYRLGFLYCLACSAAVTLAATIGHGAAGYAIVAALTTTACLGWLAWTAAKRLMPTTWPRWMSSRESLVATMALFLVALFPIALVLYLGSVVITISPYLKWLGPLGWINDLLLGLSFGHAQNALPLGIYCLVALSLGCWLNRPTSSWEFRRRLLSKYRTRPVARQAAPSRTVGERCLAHDLRQALSDRGWKSILYPRWMKGHGTSLLLYSGVVLLTQLSFAGLVLFLKSIEVGSDMALEETGMICAMLASIPGWSVLVMEGFAVFFRDLSGLSEFARRPVSPGQVWRRLQVEGLKFAPTEVLLAVPFVAITAMVAPDYAMNSCLAVLVALLACIAVRTALCAGSSCSAWIINVPPWIKGGLMLFGGVAGPFLFVAAVAGGLVAYVNPNCTPGGKVLVLLLQQTIPLAALGIAWGIWHAVGRSGRMP